MAIRRHPPTSPTLRRNMVAACTAALLALLLLPLAEAPARAQQAPDAPAAAQAPQVIAPPPGAGPGSEVEVREEPADREPATAQPTDLADLPETPGYWPVERPLPKPDIGGRDTLNFITETDYPPFNYLDETGVLVGFNIDVAWAICRALGVRCTVRRVPWDEMAQELVAGRADAAIAGHRIDRSNRTRFLFSDRYFETPARFVGRRDHADEAPSPEALAGRKVAVLRGTAHEAYLKAFFPEAELVAFDDAQQAREALRTGRAELLFGDALGLMFWLKGESSKDCCKFVGSGYTESLFFGNGVGIAVKPGNHQIARMLNYGLDQIRRAGLYRRLYARHFPMALF